MNTTYVVGVLTSVAARIASRPYWARSNPNPIGDIGSDGGQRCGHEPDARVWTRIAAGSGRAYAKLRLSSGEANRAQRESAVADRRTEIAPVWTAYMTSQPRPRRPRFYWANLRKKSRGGA